ncbi:hypothetical protein HPB49_013664 [Dermacentor silvarum]|uniref:Uncharacterized protein n=1 Tax=Dermacentor silvarum TaxID=543639 RepID=A0ACB8C9N5_DERSI|nr:hypothetical protein HPB49_013664 [Dermacentor silvarum]
MARSATRIPARTLVLHLGDSRRSSPGETTPPLTRRPSAAERRKMCFVRKQTNSAPNSMDEEVPSPSSSSVCSGGAPSTASSYLSRNTSVASAPMGSSSCGTGSDSRPGYFNFESMQRLLDLSMKVPGERKSFYLDIPSQEEDAIHGRKCLLERPFGSACLRAAEPWSAESKIIGNRSRLPAAGARRTHIISTTITAAAPSSQRGRRHERPKLLRERLLSVRARVLSKCDTGTIFSTGCSRAVSGPSLAELSTCTRHPPVGSCWAVGDVPRAGATATRQVQKACSLCASQIHSGER